jgi:hypothetical protein
MPMNRTERLAWAMAVYPSAEKRATSAIKKFMDAYREVCSTAGLKPKDDPIKAVEEFGDAYFEEVYEPEVLAKMTQEERRQLPEPKWDV